VTLLEAGHLNDVLPATYDRLFVDEYQDCSLIQHALAVGTAEMLPACVLGDPMQAIFGFKGNKLVDWDGDVHGNFEQGANFPRHGAGSTQAERRSDGGYSRRGSGFSRARASISRQRQKTLSTSSWMASMITNCGYERA
jgi:hypothetical protein